MLKVGLEGQPMVNTDDRYIAQLTMRKIQVVINDDGASQWEIWQAPLDEASFLRVAVDHFASADLLCWGVGNTKYWYRSDSVEDLDDGSEVFETVQEWMAYTTLRNLRKSGKDPLEIVCRRCHEREMDCYASLRMNDGHFLFEDPPGQPRGPFEAFHPSQLWNHRRGPGESPLTPAFWREHPAFRIGEAWEGSPFAAHLFDYAHEEVRERQLGIVRELAGACDIDGIELDFMRSPYFFKPGQTETGKGHMNRLVREARGILDEAGRAKGRGLGLCARCPTSLEGCARIGLDVETWVEEAWIDLLVPSPSRLNRFEIDLRPMVELARGRPCRVLLGMDTGLKALSWEEVRAWKRRDEKEEDDSFAELREKRDGKLGVPEGIPIESWRALASNAYADGVDGIYLFNLWDQVARHGRHADGAVLNDVRNDASLAEKDKLYALDFEASVSDHSSAHLGEKGSLPVVLKEGETNRLRMRIADDLSSVDARLILEVRLHLLFVHLTPLDRIRLEMNGEDLERFKHAPTLEAGAPAGPNAGFTDVVYLLEGRFPRAGGNEFALTLLEKNRNVRPAVYLRRFEMLVRYRGGVNP